MKKLITLLFFIFSLCLSAQKPDSVITRIDSINIKVPKITITVYKFMGADVINTSTTSPIPNPIPVPGPVHSINGDIIYMVNGHVKIGDPALQLIALNYLKQTGCIGYAPYDLATLLSKSGGAAKYNAFQAQLHTAGFLLGAVGESINNWDQIEASGIHPDFLTREYEFWNLGNDAAHIKIDSLSGAREKKLADKLGIPCLDYIGWPTKASIGELIANDDGLWIHVYRAVLDSAYLKSRLILAYDESKATGNPTDIATITSWELIFSGNTGLTLAQIKSYWAKQLKQYSPWLLDKGRIHFADDFMMAYGVPYKAPLTLKNFFKNRKNVFTKPYIDQDLIKTSPHKDIDKFRN